MAAHTVVRRGNQRGVVLVGGEHPGDRSQPDAGLVDQRDQCRPRARAGERAEPGA